MDGEILISPRTMSSHRNPSIRCPFGLKGNLVQASPLPSFETPPGPALVRSVLTLGGVPRRDHFLPRPRGVLDGSLVCPFGTGSAAESISRTMFFCRPTLHLEMLGSYCRSVGLRLVIDGDGMKVVWKGNLDFPSHDVITS